jgi:C1A family cysteine protease
LLSAFLGIVLNSGSYADDAAKHARAIAHRKRIESENTYVQQELARVRQKYARIVPPNRIQYSAVTLRKLKDITGLKLLSRESRLALRRTPFTTARTLRAGESLPRSFDLRKEIKKWAPDQNVEVHDQGNCGCCWAFAAVGAFEGNYLYKQLGRGPDVSEQYILDCTQNGCDGAQTTTGLDFLVKTGTPTRATVQYLGYSDDCSAAGPPTHPIVYRATDSGLLPNVDPSTGQVSNDDLKAAVYKHGAIVVGYYAGDAFMSPSITTESDVYDIDEPGNPPNHAITLLGWDDDRGAWLIKNSWSTRWGAGGFMWIKYGINGLGTDAAWVEAQGTPVTPPGPGPIPVPPGPVPGPAPLPIVIPTIDPAVEQMSQSIRDRLDWWSRQSFPSPLSGMR